MYTNASVDTGISVFYNIIYYFILLYIKYMKKRQEEQPVKISQLQKQAGVIGKDVIMNHKRIPIEINGRKLLALVSYKDLERLEKLEMSELENNEKFLTAMDEMGKAFQDVPDEEILANLDRIRRGLREKALFE
ncbi:MAG: hypothetical protein ACYDER_01395 [Ktedonobacteraceae bacterium]